MADHETDVAIVGSGPCGATLANLLGVYGIRAVVLDQEPGVTPYPRAVAVDDEALRTFQTAGVIDQILPDLIQNAPIRYHDSRGRQLAHVRPSGQPYGWPRRNLFYQPLLEGALREGLERFDRVTLLTATEVIHLDQDPTAVSIRARAGEETLTVRARYLVGADGGRSFVRRAVDIDLTGSTAPSKWLVVDVEQDTLDAPYSAVYCDPVRPTMTIPLPYGRRRFEFKLLGAEDEDEVVAEDAVTRLLRPFYPDGELPVIMRRRVYWHHSRVASRFQADRVFLAGDAAHLQPPFFGQGMNSGIRDATNLAWKLAAVCQGRAEPALLATYDTERRGTAEKMVSFATRMGEMYQPRNRYTEIVRDAVFRGVQLVPGARDYILQMKYKPLPRYVDGVVVGPDTRDAASPTGRPFPQPVVRTVDGVRLKLDDAVGRSFALIGLGVDPGRHLSDRSRAFWDSIGAAFVHIGAPVASQRSTPRLESADEASTADATVHLYDVDGVFRDMRLERAADEVIVLRPDRYVAATGRAGKLDDLTNRIRAATGEAPVTRSAPDRI
ncbi:MAG TPA: bifunctional 3-(3-hydroxy-phenyl)propionate/3-hydroxycinnamic acid hydroxylase [Acidimicrobiales bacterium]|nr:bifunctional 3-(3-hydroxy-phenyl)propionate/3-hydroxycinnamic acid hydroxylase [Acidimicrobiales bacterium]